MDDSNDEDYVHAIDTRDAIQAIRAALPDHEEIRTIFDLSTGQGEMYEFYSQIYGDAIPRLSDMEQFMGISQRTINLHRKTIRVYCLYYGLTPTS